VIYSEHQTPEDIHAWLHELSREVVFEDLLLATKDVTAPQSTQN
jgi:hypothetical protein